MPDIVAFLTARLNEDQAAAESATMEIDRTDYRSGADFGPALARLWFHRRFTPARVLRQVASARRVMARHMTPSLPGDPYRVCHGCGYEYGEIDLRYDVDQCPELCDLAAVYDDHPDYDPAWRVE